MTTALWETFENIRLTLLFCTSWLPHALTFLVVGALFLLLFTDFYWISIVYLIWYIVDYNAPKRGGHFCGYIRKIKLWTSIQNYYPAKIHKTVDLNPAGNYIFAMHPHGHINCFTGNGDWLHQLFPGLTVHLLTVDSFFKWPLLREWLLALGCGSVSAESIEYKLTKLGSGHSVAIAVGGRQEMYWANTGQYHLRVAKRKGFIRLALKTGAKIVPVFAYGINDGYDTGPERSLWHWFFRICDIPNIRGRFWLFVPKQKPINIVVGKPIAFDRMTLKRDCDVNDLTTVDACHKIYFDELRKFYEDNKDKFGDSRQLIYV